MFVSYLHSNNSKSPVRFLLNIPDMPTRFAASLLRFSNTIESQNVSAAELYVHLPSCCWSNRTARTDFSRRAFPVFSIVCLKLDETGSSDQRLPVCFKSGLFVQSGFSGLPWLTVWCSGNALVSINAVALHRARLVLGWVTAFGQVNCLIT